MLRDNVLMIQFPVFGTAYVPERHNLVEAGDPRSLIAECRVQRPSSTDAIELQATPAEAEATANS